MTNAAKARCNATDHASRRPQFSCSRKMSALATIALERLGHDTYVADAGLFHRVHHRSESAERQILVRSQEDGLVLRFANIIAPLVCDIIENYRFVSTFYSLAFINRNYKPHFCVHLCR